MAKVISTYDFDTDTAGLRDWLTDAFADMEIIRDGEHVVYVEDAHGNPAKVAKLVRETLTDGSTVVNLVIDFHFT